MAFAPSRAAYRAHLPGGWFSRNVVNRFVAWLTRRGLSVAGSRVLEVRGRTSGEWRRTPVNLLTLEGTRYLVAPRGEVQIPAQSADDEVWTSAVAPDQAPSESV